MGHARDSIEYMHLKMCTKCDSQHLEHAQVDTLNSIYNTHIFYNAHNTQYMERERAGFEKWHEQRKYTMVYIIFFAVLQETLRKYVTGACIANCHKPVQYIETTDLRR